MPDHHAAITRRLRRANGHLQTIIEMIEQGRSCAQIAQQLQTSREPSRMRRRRSFTTVSARAWSDRSVAAG
ncbi:metal-sensing transcriptional repressor [Bradyrhizobium sp.]|uniref:metal-sensing transcriptional repressor n=1 Tax=Bradyrhizobium sp. TaxID=376 RepID=UPI00343284CA